MKRERPAIVFVLLLGTGCLFAPSALDAASKKPQHGAPPVNGTQVSVHVVFSRHDVQVIREYYAPRYRSLPPGLQKKYQRTGHLPPGWQKKVQPFPVVLDRRLVALPVGYSRGVIDGHAVIFNSRTGTIFDVAVLF